MKNRLHILLAAVAILGVINTSRADTIDLVGTTRKASLTDAVSGVMGLNNPGVGDINTAFGGTWTMEGELVGNGTNDLLSVNVTSGSWGSSNVGGTWAINSSFWLTYGNAVISMHVGNGGGDPDYFAWLITPGETSGTFSYLKTSGTGGGLSNLKLWGSDEPTRVPDGGTTAMLLGLALVGMGVIARRKSA